MPLLDYDAFRRSVKKGEILPAYYFHGNEDLLKDDALGQLLAAALEPGTRDFNLDRRRAADMSADDFWALALTPPMLASRRVVVLTEVEDLQQRRPRAQGLRAAIVKYLASSSPETLLILVQSAAEKADDELARLATGVDFAPLSPERLQRWIRHRAESEKLEIDEDGARHLLAAVGADLPQLAAEISKLRAAVADRVATASDVSDLVGVRRGETVPDFADAVTGRRFAVAVQMIPYLLQGPGATGVRLVTALGTAMVGVALARALLDRGGGSAGVARDLLGTIRSSRPLGLGDWGASAERWTRDAAGWTADELDHAMAALLGADRRLKSPTLGGEAAIVADAVLAMAGAARAAA